MSSKNSIDTEGEQENVFVKCNIMAIIEEIPTSHLNMNFTKKMSLH